MLKKKNQLLCKGQGCRTPEVINAHLSISLLSLFSDILKSLFCRKKYVSLFRAASCESMSAASLQWNHNDDADFMKEV